MRNLAILALAISLICTTNDALAQKDSKKRSASSDSTTQHGHKHARRKRPHQRNPFNFDSPATRPLDDFYKTFMKWEHATGDWEGKRPWLEEHGINIEGRYTADYFYNLHGGLNSRSAGECRGLFELSAELDTHSLGLWDDGTFYLSMLQNHGRDISLRHVGDLQALNNNDAPNDTRLYEFYYEHTLFDDLLRIKVGKMDANEDFAAPDFGGEFIHSSSGFSPTIPMPTWPDPALGIAAFLEPTEWLYMAAGVYDAQGSGTQGGFDTAFHSPNDAFTIFEFGLRPEFDLFGQQDLPGTYRAGGFYHSGKWEEIPSPDSVSQRTYLHTGNAGFYLVFDQLLFREDPHNLCGEQGLGMFLQYAWSPSNRNEITQHIGGGLQYIGLFHTRDYDVTGLAMHHVYLSDRIRSVEGRSHETAIELFHRFQIHPSVVVKPDIQYIVNPGGDGTNALVAGLRFELAL